MGTQPLSFGYGLGMSIIVLGLGAIILLTRGNEGHMNRYLGPATQAISISSARQLSVMGDNIDKKLDVAIFVEFSNFDRYNELAAMLNSMIYFKTCFLRIHAVVADTQTRHVLERWTSSHQASYSNYSILFHRPAEIDRTIIVDTFRSPFAMQKAFPARALPNWVDRVIIVDFDQLWLHDICEAADSQFGLFEKETLFGMSGEMSGWYAQETTKGFAFPISAASKASAGLSKISSDWAGLNSGVSFVDLKKMRSFDWANKVYDLVRRSGGKIFQLGDQDVYNWMGRVYPDIVHVMPFAFNFQVQGMNFECDDATMKLYEFPQRIFVAHGNTCRFKDGTLADPVYRNWLIFTDEIFHSGKIATPEIRAQIERMRTNGIVGLCSN